LAISYQPFALDISSASLTESLQDEQDYQRSDYRQNKPGGMKGSAVRGFREDPSNQATDDRSNNSEQNRCQQAKMDVHDPFCDQSRNKPDNDVPDNV
jgi:hypothetical protein